MEEKVLSADNPQVVETLESKKGKLTALLFIPWILIAVILITSTVFSIISYNKYLEGQEMAVALTTATLEAIGEDDYLFAYYKDGDITTGTLDAIDDDKQLAEALYDWYNLDLDEFYLEATGKTYSNIDVVSARQEADNALAELLCDAGYQCYHGSDYLEYTNIFSYTSNENFIFVIIYIIGFSLILLQIIFTLWYANNKKQSMVVDSSRVICKVGNKTKKEFLIQDISSVESYSAKGLRIKGAGINYKINRLTNADELKSYLMNMIEKNKSDTPVASSNDNHLSNVDELKKYKELLDSGVITQEEFDAKKKQLLGL